MTEELVQTLRVIIERYGARTSGSVCIPMRDFPGRHGRNAQLAKLQEKGYITQPLYYDNNAEITLTQAGREFFDGILFPAPGSPMACPVCGCRATVLQSDAARSWAEIACKNCATYAIEKNALTDVPAPDLPILSGYYRHAWHEPGTMQCDNRERVKEHIENTRGRITRAYQMKLLLRYYYQKMKDFADRIPFEPFPAIACAKNRDDLLQLLAEAVKKGYAVSDGETIAVTRQGKEWMDASEAGEMIMTQRNEIFISHKSIDAGLADMIKDFLVATGIPNARIFCSSLPGNNVKERIAPEVKQHLQHASIIILLLSRDFYRSAYCLNEAGVAWYLDGVRTIPIGLPETEPGNMNGFLGADYKLRRLDNDDDIAYLYDEAQKRLNAHQTAHGVVTQEGRKLKERYGKYLAERPENAPTDMAQKMAALEAENARLRKTIEAHGWDADGGAAADDAIWEDGYHEVTNGDGTILKKGQFVQGNLIDGIEYNVVLYVARGEKGHEEPVPPEELKKEKWRYAEYGQYLGIFRLMIGSDEIIETGLQFFYVVDKKLKLEGRLVKPTFTNFRTLELFLGENEPDELDEIKTGVRKYEQTDSADIEVD